MVFSGIPFLYYFLPCVLAVYYIAPAKLKNFVLLLSSLAFYFVGERELVLVMLFSVVFNYAAALLISRYRTNKLRLSKALLIFAIAVNFGLLGYFKYADFFISNFNSLTGLSVPLLKIALPIGISFYTFQTMSYTVDVYRGKVIREKNLIDLAAYITMFPQLIAGPIVRYEDVAADLKIRSHSFEKFGYGVRRFTIGLAKKVILANTFASLISELSYSGEISVLAAWMSALAFTLQIYFDFSGYSDMAIGLGQMLGFSFPENFNYPYVSKSITEFWRRWHITLSVWFRDYVYIPLGGNRVKRYRWVINILVVWLFTGFWHGAAWNFIVWGGIYGLLLLGEKLLWGRFIERIPSVFGHIYTLLFVVLGFVVFSAGDLSGAAVSIGHMFGVGGISAAGEQSVYYLKSYAVVFITAFFAATPLISRLVGRIKPAVVNILEPVVCVVLLLVSTGYLIDGSFNPFLYFRF